jgi:hypothetical protein
VSWTRFDDLFTDQSCWDGVSYEARWHYLALVQTCSRQGRWDGWLPLANARRASDVPNPDGCLSELERVGLVAVVGDNVIVRRIDEHVPPAYIRENAAKTRERMRRKRAHDRGDHSLCGSDCVVPRPVTGVVTRNTGTGRDRTGT